MITAYVILKEQTTEELARLVIDKINEGWQPFGNPFTDGNAVEWFCYQAMVRYAPQRYLIDYAPHQ